MTAPSIGTDLLAYNFNLDTQGFLAHFKSSPPFHAVGQSFMHELAREGDVLSMEVMINAGGEVDLPDDEGRRPLHEAAFFGHLDMVEFLLRQGALIDAPVHPFGFTALYYAVQQSRYGVVRCLIKKGARLFVEDALMGHGLLHIAAQKGDKKMAGMLIAAGVNIFHEDKKGMTARDHAARAGHIELEAALLKVMQHHARFCV